MSSPFVGQIMIFAGSFAPQGWAICVGRSLSVEENQQLFNAIRTTYGGDGVSTFALPDLRGRVPLGSAS
jgi:microcystin-dependent protein